ncbi:hypothetical protein PG990_010851 [Apiospora arundinis]
MFINTTVNNNPPKTASMAFPIGVAAAKGLNPCSQPFHPAAATFSALSLNNDVRGAATTQNLGNSTATPFKLPAAITNSAAPAAHVNPFSVKPPPPPPTNPFLLKPPSTDGNPLFHPSSVAVSSRNEESSSGSDKPYTQSHRPRPQGGQHNPNRSTALYPQSYRPRPPRRQQKRQNKNQGGNKVSYPDYYSPARDKVNLCKGLRRNALSPEKLNSVLDCLEDVDRLQDQLIHARRELSNMALFGLKNGRNRGGSVSPKRLTRKQRSGQATPILAPSAAVLALALTTTLDLDLDLVSWKASRAELGWDRSEHVVPVVAVAAASSSSRPTRQCSRTRRTALRSRSSLTWTKRLNVLPLGPSRW